MEFRNHLEVNQCQLINALFHTAIVPPPNPVMAQVYYHGTHQTVNVHNGAAFIPLISADKLIPASNSGIQVIRDLISGIVQVGLLADNTTIRINESNNVSIVEGGIRDVHIGLAAQIQVSKLGNGASGQIMVANATGVWTPVNMTGAVTISNAGVTSLNIAAGGVTHAMIANGAACSVFGRSANTVGVMGSIAAAADNQILARVGGSLAFQSLSNEMIPVNTVGLNKISNALPCSIIGRSLNTPGAFENIVASANGLILTRIADVVGFAEFSNAMIPNNSIGHDKIISGSACSVFGRSVNVAGAMGSISAATNNRLLGRVADSISFVQVNNDMILDNTIAYNKLINTNGPNIVLGKMGALGTVGPITVIVSTDSTARNDNTLISAKAAMDYADSILTSVGTLQGGWMALGQTTFPGGATTKMGDYWFVTVAGTVLGVNFNVGDVIKANRASPTNTFPEHYIFLESNRDAATTVTPGWVRMAASADMTGLVGGAVAINPAILNSHLVSRNYAAVAQQLIGNAIATQFDIVHNFGTLGVMVQLYDVATGNMFLASVRTVDVNTVRVSFGRPPANNGVRVVIFGNRAA